MKIDAAVLREPNNMPVEEVELDDPKPGEVLVDNEAVGVCATDLHRYVGAAEFPLPAVLGHEGAGVVEEVGEGVTSVEPGDNVISFAVSPCGECPWCNRGEETLCSTWVERGLFGGVMLDGTKRISKDGEEISSFMYQSSFAEKSVVPEQGVVKVNPDAPAEKIAPLGCGFTTAIGGVFNTADIEPGSTIAVFGCGGLGSAAITAANAVGAEIIAVDINPNQLELAEKIGADYTINSSEEDPLERIPEITDPLDGTEYSFEFVGHPDVMQQALESTMTGGTAIITGEGPPDKFIDVNCQTILQGRSLKGNVEGMVEIHSDIPKYVDMFMAGDLELDKIVTREYSGIDEITDALDALEEGEIAGRSVVKL